MRKQHASETKRGGKVKAGRTPVSSATKVIHLKSYRLVRLNTADYRLVHAMHAVMHAHGIDLTFPGLLYLLCLSDYVVCLTYLAYLTFTAYLTSRLINSPCLLDSVVGLTSSICLTHMPISLKGLLDLFCLSDYVVCFTHFVYLTLTAFWTSPLFDSPCQLDSVVG